MYARQMFIAVINAVLEGELNNMDSQVHAKLNELQILINYKVQSCMSAYYYRTL